MTTLQGKSILVTGGGSGIGAPVAMALARAGAIVMITGRTVETLAAVCRQARDQGLAIEHATCDITRRSDIEAVLGETLRRLGGLDALINNAGGAGPADMAPLLDLDEAVWNRVVDLNLKWPFFVAQAAARQMRSGGSIVNISSSAVALPSPLMGHYGAAKAGLQNLTAVMALEWGHLGIRVNAVAPGVIDTVEKRDRRSPAWRARQAATSPLGRIGVPDDVAAACVFLVSDASAWITGAVLPVNGGGFFPLGHEEYFAAHPLRARSAPG